MAKQKTDAEHLASFAWEYHARWLRVSRAQDPGVDAAMSELGALGWELVAVTSTSGGVRCFFKRPKASAAQALARTQGDAVAA